MSDSEEKKFKNICTSMPIYVPEDISWELELKILAAITSHQMGIKSIDGTLKRYGDIWLARLENQEAQCKGEIQ